jgi:formate/nitrite transporter FocA (FNT family)
LLHPGAAPSLGAALGNLLPVIAGNLLGGSVLVALVYWVTYRRPVADRGPQR